MTIAHDSPPSSAVQRPRALIWLFAIILFGAVGMLLRFWFLRQPANSDDIQYFHIAMSFDGEAAAAFPDEVRHEGHTTLRIALLSIVRACIGLFGYSISTYYACVYLIALCSCVGILCFSWVVSDVRTAAIATLFWATSFVFLEADCRLVPDNLGTSVSLISLALLACAVQRRRGGLLSHDHVRPGWATVIAALCSGLLLWVAFSVRETFGIFLLAAGLAAMLSRWRRQLLPSMGLGFLLGSAFELYYFDQHYGDPWIRWKILLGYGERISAAAVFQGYTYWQLVCRYPKLLAETGSGEAVLHALGWLGVVAWAVRCRSEVHRIKLFALLLSYSLIAIGVVKLNPAIPLLREKLRYYVTAAPLFYIAAADLLVLMGDYAYRFHGRLKAGNEAAPGSLGIRLQRGVAVLGLCVIFIGALGLAVANAVAAGKDRDLVRNGNHSFLEAASEIRHHAGGSQDSRRLFSDFRTSRVLRLLLRENAGWQSAPLEGLVELRTSGYLVLNWKRLNANVERQLYHADWTHRFYRTIETRALLLRHRHYSDLSDVFLVSPRPIRRKIEDMTELASSGWSRLLPGKEYEYLGPVDEVSLSKGNLVYTGADKPWRHPKSSSLAKQHFVEVVFDARAEETSGFAAHLYCWTKSSGRLPKKLYIGRAYANPTPREVAFWTYMPEAVDAFRIVLRGLDDASVWIENVRFYLLEQHEDDVIHQTGGAW